MPRLLIKVAPNLASFDSRSDQFATGRAWYHNHTWICAKLASGKAWMPHHMCTFRAAGANIDDGNELMVALA